MPRLAGATAPPGNATNVYRDGPYIVAPLQGAWFPSRCVLSNAPTFAADFPIRVPVNLWVSDRMLQQIGIPLPAVVILIPLMLCTGGAFIVLMLLTTRVGRFRIGLAADVQRARHQRSATRLLLLLFCIAVVVAGGVQKAMNEGVRIEDQLPAAVTWGIIGAGVLGSVVCWFGFLLSLMAPLRVRDSDGRNVWLSGAHRDFVAALPALPTARR